MNASNSFATNELGWKPPLGTKRSNVEASDHFDLISGTSTGGILAIGLGMGLSATEMLQFYKQRGPHIFPVTGFGRKFGRALRQVMQPKYSGEILRRELLSAFKEKKFGESQVRLVIPTYGRRMASERRSSRAEYALPF
jgi:patatin-like phospholipase/acyl hydrolase